MLVCSSSCESGVRILDYIKYFDVYYRWLGWNGTYFGNIFVIVYCLFGRVLKNEFSFVFLKIIVVVDWTDFFGIRWNCLKKVIW